MSRGPGRPRDDRIDQRVLSAARRHLARDGYQALSVASVAAEAGTTRQAVYRRWPSLADLATAAIADLPEAAERPPGPDPFADLLGELRAFHDGIRRPDGVSMAATMLIAGTDAELVELYRDRLVRPRRRRIRAALERGLREGQLRSDADVELAVTMCTGSWYAAALAGDPAPADWPERTAALVWRALGGDPPAGPPAAGGGSVGRSTARRPDRRRPER